MQAICTYRSHFCHLHPQSLFLSTYLLRYSFLTFSVSSSSACLFDVNIHSFLLSSLLACKQLQYFFFNPNYGSGNQSVLWIFTYSFIYRRPWSFLVHSLPSPDSASLPIFQPPIVFRSLYTHLYFPRRQAATYHWLKGCTTFSSSFFQRACRLDELVITQPK